MVTQRKQLTDKILKKLEEYGADPIALSLAKVRLSTKSDEELKKLIKEFKK